MNRAIVDGVHWVGFVDWNIRDFHGYVTDRGSTYNSYLVLDREIALVDTVKAPYAADLLRNVSELAKLSVALRNHKDTVFVEKQRSECRRFLLCTREDSCCLEVHGLTAMFTLRLWREGTLVCDEGNLNPDLVCLNGVAIFDDEIVLE